MPYFDSSAGPGSRWRCSRKLGSIKGRLFFFPPAVHVDTGLSSSPLPDACLRPHSVPASVFRRPETKRRTPQITFVIADAQLATRTLVSESAESRHVCLGSTWKGRHRICQACNGHYWKCFSTSEYRHLISRRLDGSW